MAECCTILGKHLDLKKKWVTSVRKNGREWVPMFLEYVDAKKCTGCELCIKVCTGYCFEMREIKINNKKKKVSVAVNPNNCLGECSCHLICPVKGGAMVCEPKAVKR